MSNPIKSSVKAQQLEELKKLVNITTNPEEKDKLKKKILKQEQKLENHDSIYQI